MFRVMDANCHVALHFERAIRTQASLCGMQLKAVPPPEGCAELQTSSESLDMSIKSTAGGLVVVKTLRTCVPPRLGGLKHPNIMPCVQLDANAYSMTYEAGGCLQRMLSKHGPVREELSIMRALRHMLGGLAYLHQNDICHRDLKPANILLCGLDRAATHESMKCATFRLIDLEVGVQYGTESYASPVSATGFPGFPYGTCAYMAPEVAAGQKHTPAADVWSLGVTLLCILSHKWLLVGDVGGLNLCSASPHVALMHLAAMRDKTEARFMLDVVPGEMLVVKEIAMWCLRPQSGERPSVSELREVVGSALQDVH